MVKSKAALISSIVILVILMVLFFPFPDYLLWDARSAFMLFPIRNQDGYVPLGIVGSILFVIALILLGMALKKFRLRMIVLVSVAFVVLPLLLITIYQETFATGINAISYDRNGFCQFEEAGKEVVNGECYFVLHNRSNQDVTLQLEFLDTSLSVDGVRMESLMNLAGPYQMTIKANHKESIELLESLDVSDVPNHIQGGGSAYIHFKLIQGEKTRIM